MNESILLKIFEAYQKSEEYSSNHQNIDITWISNSISAEDCNLLENQIVDIILKNNYNAFVYGFKYAFNLISEIK